MASIPLEGLFKAWCERNGISPHSHDYSIAKAAWMEAVRLVWEAMEKAAKKEKN